MWISAAAIDKRCFNPNGKDSAFEFSCSFKPKTSIIFLTFSLASSALIPYSIFVWRIKMNKEDKLSFNFDFLGKDEKESEDIEKAKKKYRFNF